VIVGKQSVGKSSLLEALTEIPFPVGDGLCTRFATRIISRRTTPGTPDMVAVSIENGDVNPFGDADGDGQTGNLELEVQHPITVNNFKDVIRQVCLVYIPRLLPNWLT
jgi:GTPase SAR1 family protein